MIYDWHKTQNDDYLNLSKQRLKEDKLIWVQQFVDIINNFCDKNNCSFIKIKDIGCNVGHFYRGIDDIKIKSEYYGYDISDTYLSIAKNNFPKGNFLYSNVEDTMLENTDITVISATYEHLYFHNEALLNIFNSTNSLIILRTFIGDSYKQENCYKHGADLPYVIKQFNIDYFFSSLPIGWTLEVVEDLATNSISKCVCKNIYRTQKVLVFKRE